MSAIHENTRLKTGLVSAAILCAATAMTVLAAPSMAAPGNNGTVKVAPYGDVDAIPDNQPHVGCTFQLEWFGFDAGVTSTVLFEEQAPTTGVGMSVAGDTTVDLDSDPGAGAGNDGFDGTQAYTLAFTGAPHPQQGYHVKLTIDTPESNGASVKHKVFWVEGCEPTTPPETETPQTETPENPETPVTPVTETPSAEVLPAEASEEPSPEANPTEGGNEQPAAEVLGEQAFANESSAQDQAQAEVLGEQAFAGESVELPTAVNAGASDAAEESTGSSTWSIAGLMMILLGIMTGGLAWVRRARG